MRPASFVAWRWASLKYAGTVITARSTVSSKKFFGPGFQFAQDECGNFGRREDFFAEPHANHVCAGRFDAERENLQLVFDVVGGAAHQALYGINRALGLREQAALGGFAGDDRAVGVYADDGRAERGAVRAGDTLRLARRASMYAIRLYVVPRSIPTIFPIT